MKQNKHLNLTARRMVILLALVALLVPSGGMLSSVSSDITPQTTAEPTPIVTPEVTPVLQAAVVTTSAPTLVPTSTPIPTPAPTPHLLPMDDFSTGSTPNPDGYGVGTYSDDTISVTLWREAISGSVYNCCDVQIKDSSQLRAAIAGSVSNPSTLRFSKLAARNNPVVAIDGDFYHNRKGSYALRQGQVLQSNNTSPLDMLIIDYDGNFHIFSAEEKVQALEDMQGQLYQVYSFGPALVRDGVMQIPSEDYLFDPTNDNPRAAIGQLGELHYLLVVVDGRTSYSKGITETEMAAFMTAKGCIQAYGFDGGASACLYFNGEIYNYGTGTGERSMYDILYFASAAQ